MARLPKNVIVRRLLVTDLSQLLKSQRDFLRWMARKYTKEDKVEVAAAFTTGAEKLHEIRQDLLDGLFDAPAKEELTNEERRRLGPAAAPRIEYNRGVA